jgi:hypothetical protein
MRLGVKKTVEVEAKELRIHMKVCDGFEGAIYDQDGQQIGKDYEGYVPGFMPGQHYGDYLILNIDLETGKILNWQPPSKEEIENFINRESSD